MRRGPINDVDSDRLGKARSFSKTRFDITRAALAPVRVNYDGPRPAGKAFFALKFKPCQNVELILIVCTFFGKIERVCGLDC